MNKAWLTIIIISGLCQRESNGTICTARGKYANTLNNDCRGYTMCLGVNNTRIDLVCPENSIYSHLDSQCTNITSYQCMPEFNCTSMGEFPNPNINDCSSYITCVEALGVIVNARLVKCPPDMLFSTTVSDCVNNTLFNCKLTTTEPPKDLNVSVKYSPELNNTFVTKKSHCMKSELVILLFVVYFLLN